MEPAVVLVAETVATSGSVVLQSPETWTRELLIEADGIGQYLLVFLLAATPLVEILIVIPVAIGVGLQPLAVGVVAFLGNVMPIYGIVLAHEQLATFLARRGNSTEPSSRRKRAETLWEKYRLPGLAAASPITTRVHLAALLALGLGSTRRSTALWMTASIAVWAALITLGSLTALSAIQSFMW